MSPLMAFVVVGAASWLLRIGFLVLLPVHRLPEAVRSALDHLPPAVLASIVAADLSAVLTGGASAGSSAVTVLVTAVVAAVAWMTRNLAITALLALVAVAVIDLAPV